MEKQLENKEVTEQDTVLLPGVSEYRKNIQDYINKLGEVLNELTVREALDDLDTLGWMSRYVAEARMFLGTLKSDFS